MSVMAQYADDERFMREALRLAAFGAGRVSPNPRVGCVIVRDGVVIGRGWHRACGMPHAEVEAVADAGGDIAGACVYVNLEPCCHYGKTPPCAQMLVEKKAARVVAGMADPNPVVDRRGLGILRDAGIEIAAGVLEAEAKKLNRGFIMRMKHGRPWVTLKIASSLDGNIALADGSSKWITGTEARRAVHAMRAENDAVLTGVGTVLADDPKLTVRDACGKQPLRVILDRNLRTPEDAALFDGNKNLFFISKDAPAGKIQRFKAKGAVFEYADGGGAEQIKHILWRLSEKGVNYLMVEAGARVTSAFLSAGLADELALFLAPKLMGDGIGYSRFLNVKDMDSCPGLKDTEYAPCGGDLLVKGVFECSPDL